MTGFTKSHQIASLIAAALRERKDVVDFFGRRQLALLLTLLAEGMQLDVAVTDALPAPAVAFVGLGIAFILVVLFVHDLLMLGTVLLAVCKPTAAGVGTGTLWFIGHSFHLLAGIKKALRGFLPQGSSSFCFPDYNTIIIGRCLSVSFRVHFG